jgi:glycosyltransferase involved in cell wall biosynthesis
MIAQALAEHNDLVVVTVSDKYEQWNDGAVLVKSIGSPNLYWNYWEPHPAAAKIAWHLLENFNPRALFRMLKEIRQERPDIVVTISIENINTATWLAARLHRIPTVHFIQSHYLLCWRGSMFKQRKNCPSQCLSCKLITSGRKFFTRYVDSVTAEAEPTLKLHFDHGYFNSASSFVAPAMLETIDTVSRPSDRTDRPLKVGYLGRLTYSKGVHVIARAARRLPSPDQVEIIIAGDGDQDYRNELTVEFDGVPASFEGWVAPADFFSKIDVLVVPSLWREPFGRVCIESFAAGVPVLASKIGGMTSVVESNRNGFLFDPGDADQLARILESLINDRCQLRVLQSNCLEDAELYQVDRVGSIIQQELQKLVSSRKADQNSTVVE